MSRKISAFIPYVLALAVIFYVFPLLVFDTGSGMFLMLIVIPLLTFACCAVYGMRNGFNAILAIIAAAMFVPSIFIFYNSSAWIYIPVYGIVSLAGNLVGMILYRKKNG